MIAATPRRLQVLLLLLLAASSACEVELRGVPIIERHPGAAPMHDGSAQEPDGSAQEPDGSVADEEGGEPPPDDSDGAVDEGLSSYRYHFDQPVLDDTWKLGAEGVAEVWDGRLCMHSGGSVELKLTPGRYGYVRVDVPSERGLSLSALTEDGELFEVKWQADATEAVGSPDVALFDLPVSNQYPFAVTEYEIEPDFESRSVRVRPRGGKWQTSAFAANVEGKKLLSLVFRHQHNEWLDAVVCLDNVYVAPARPTDKNPFADAPPVNACVPATSIADSRCIAEHCCNETRDVFRTLCWESCPTGECPCTFMDVAECAATCIRSHPSHSASDCTDMCRIQTPAWSLARCADDYCAGERAEPVLAPLSPPSEPSPPSAHSKRLKIEFDPLAQKGVPTWLELVELDLRSHVRVALAELLLLSGEGIVLYAEPSHARAIALVLGTDGPNRLYLWDAETADGELTEVRLPEPVQSVTPSETRRYAWVSTLSSRTGLRHLYLLKNDTVLSRQIVSTNMQVGFGPHERYAVASFGDSATIIDLVAGRTDHFSLGVQGSEWQPGACFDSSVAWLSRPADQPALWSWLGLDGMPVSGILPPAPGFPPPHLPEDSAFLAGASHLYARGSEAPLEVAALPAAYDAESWSARSSSDGRVLYHVFEGGLTPGVVPGHGLTMADATGAVLATLAPVLPEAPEGTEVYAVLHSVVPFDANHGIFATDQLVGNLEEGAVGTMLLDAYAFDGSAFTTHRLSTKPFVTFDRYPIFTRTDSSIFVIEREEPTQPLIYDVVNRDTLTYIIDEYDLPGSVWAQYPPREAHRAASP